jgi:hypothetical protein
VAINLLDEADLPLQFKYPSCYTYSV